VRLFAVIVRAVRVLLRQFTFALRLFERRLAMMVGGSIVMSSGLMVRRTRGRISGLRLTVLGF